MVNVKVIPPLAVRAHVLQVEEEMEGLREFYMRRPEEDEEEEEREGKEADNIRTTSSSSSPEKKKQVDACWQETLQRFLSVQELGNNYINTVSTVTRLSGTGISESSRIHFALWTCRVIFICVCVCCQASGAALHLQSVVSVVQQMVERLSRTKQEVNELQSQQQIQIQQQEYCGRYQERLLKVHDTLCRCNWLSYVYYCKVTSNYSCQMIIVDYVLL